MQSIDEYYKDIQARVLSRASAHGSFHTDEFMELVADELTETGVTEGFTRCHLAPRRGIQVDGFWFDDEDNLFLFITDFEQRSTLETLTRTEADALFKRLTNFVSSAIEKQLFADLDQTTVEYELAYKVYQKQNTLARVTCLILSERRLSDRIHELPEQEVTGLKITFDIWDVTRMHRQATAKGHKEPLDLDIAETFGKGIACLPAHVEAESYKSYLLAMPGNLLADLYGQYGPRLLEQNVRSFLQARGNVNKGIRATILNEPEMFFAYNNGITATAEYVEINGNNEIIRLRDLQIVNGGQTTASLYHVRRKDNAPLDRIFVQVKLSVIGEDRANDVIPKISEYANTQNKINAADFFSNHPFHVRIEEISRRLWAPPPAGQQRQTKWFYERARGQYADELSKLTPAKQREFKAIYPKAQMFTKTDLAKFENVWDEHPKWVNYGAQKNFAQYAKRIGMEWERSQLKFNKHYFMRIVTRALIFRTVERIVSKAEWYEGGYRANIVAYGQALFGVVLKRQNKVLDVQSIWRTQEVSNSLAEVLESCCHEAKKCIYQPPRGISNISEWCKKDACWESVQKKANQLSEHLPSSPLWDELADLEDEKLQEKSSKGEQRIINGIQAQTEVVNKGMEYWKQVHTILSSSGIFTQKELGCIKTASQMPNKVPTENQCIVILQVIEKARQEGYQV